MSFSGSFLYSIMLASKMFPYSEFNDFICSTNGPFVNYLFRVSLIGFDWVFCYQNTGELPDKITMLIKAGPTTIIC